MQNNSSYVEMSIFSPVIASFLHSPYVAYVYCSEVMGWFGYGNKTGKYVDTCSIKCSCACGYGLGSAGIWFPCMGYWYNGFGSSGCHWM